MERTKEELQSRRDAFGVTLVLSIALALIALTGCVSMQEGEVKVIRSTTCGLILAYDPITNLPVVKMGWNELQVMRTLNAKAKMEAEHTDISILTGSGNIKRFIDIK